MPSTWATLGPCNRSKGRRGADQSRGADFLQLDPATARRRPSGDDRRGLGDWLTSAVRDAVSDGRLPPGSRLPATRALAGQLGMSRGVVVEAYQRLTDEGLVGGRRGGGTTVLSDPGRHRPCPWPKRRRAPCRSTCAPDSPTSRRSPGRPGWPRTRRADPHAGRRPRLRRPARHPRAARRPRDVAGPLPRRAGRPVDDRGRRRGRARPRTARPGAAPGAGWSTVGYEDPGSRRTRDQLRTLGAAGSRRSRSTSSGSTWAALVTAQRSTRCS